MVGDNEGWGKLWSVRERKQQVPPNPDAQYESYEMRVPTMCLPSRSTAMTTSAGKGGGKAGGDEDVWCMVHRGQGGRAADPMRGRSGAKAGGNRAQLDKDFTRMKLQQ